MKSQPNAGKRRLRRAVAGVAALAAAAAGVFAGTAGAAADEREIDPQLVVYVEVNSNDLANVADYTLEGSGEAAVDMAMIFAANINYDGEKAYLHFNERVTETLQDAENQIRPVQAKGTKVLLSVLGNHQGAGFANFTSYEAADAFAAQLADAVTTYGLDGIDFDDEWTNYGANGTPQPNAESFGWLVTALRDRLGPDKVISLYAIGPSYTTTDFTLFDAAGTIDYAWNPYYPTYDAPTVPGLEDRARLGAAAIDLSQTPATTAADFAERTVQDGYGIYVAYNLTGTDQSAYLSGITEPLKGSATVYKAPAAPDTTRPTVELAGPASNRPQPELNVSLSAQDDRGLATIVANVYQHGKLVTSTQTDAAGMAQATHTATVALPDGHYILRYNAHDTSGNVSKTKTQPFTIDSTP